jgi:hypothetical protein
LDAQAIIRELNSSHGLPREALAAASAQREEMAPVFIAEIERYIARPDQRPQPDAIFFMVHLLAEWRETSAYPALARFMRLPCEELDRVLDDAITMTTHRVMVAVFDGDAEPLYDIILDPEANEFVRARMCEALALLVAQGRLDRAATTAFLRDGFERIQPQATCHVWHGWQMAIAIMGAEELSPLVEEAFKREYIDPEIQDFGYFQRDLEQALASPDRCPWLEDEEYLPFGNTIDEFANWHGFTDAYRRELDRIRQGAREWLMLHGPAHNPNRDVGRNDPCPCGSGEKYKKCCLH